MCLDDVGQVHTLAPLGSPEEGTAVLTVAGRDARVSLVVLDLESTPVSEGDWLLVHTGIAVAVMSEADARAVLDQRAQMRAALADYAEPDTGEGRPDDTHGTAHRTHPTLNNSTTRPPWPSDGAGQATAPDEEVRP